MATSKQNIDLKWLHVYYFKYMEILGIKTFDDLIKKFVKNSKFVRYENTEQRITDIVNFNIGVAKILFENGYISEREYSLQDCIYSYTQSRWVAKLLKDNNVVYIGDAVKKCIENDGSFYSIGGSNYKQSSNYEVAKILRKTEFLSEAEFLKVARPKWNYRKLNEKELNDIKNISIPMELFPPDTQILINALYNRTYNHAWCKYQQPISFGATTSLRFLAEEFLRVSPWDNIPVLKLNGYRLNAVYGPWWTEKNIETIFKPVANILRENFLIV